MKTLTIDVKKPGQIKIETTDDMTVSIDRTKLASDPMPTGSASVVCGMEVSAGAIEPPKDAYLSGDMVSVEFSVTNTGNAVLTDVMVDVTQPINPEIPVFECDPSEEINAGNFSAFDYTFRLDQLPAGFASINTDLFIEVAGDLYDAGPSVQTLAADITAGVSKTITYDLNQSASLPTTANGPANLILRYWINGDSNNIIDMPVDGDSLSTVCPITLNY